jgi:hypothetical protein
MLHLHPSHVLTPIAVLALAAAALPASTHAVNAAASQCPREEVCVWTGGSYSGGFTSIQNEACDTAPVGSAMNNDPDRLQQLRIYAQPGCAGSMVVVGSGSADPGVSGRSYQNWHDPSDPVEGP